MPQLVVLRQSVEVVVQAKDAQRPHENAETDREVAALKAVEGPSRYADPLGHLGRGDPTSLPSKTQALAKPLCLAPVARVCGDGLLRHVQYTIH
jgi:hypothetical protein